MFLYCNRALCVQYARTAILEIEFFESDAVAALRCCYIYHIASIAAEAAISPPVGRKRDAFSPVFLVR